MYKTFIFWIVLFYVQFSKVDLCQPGSYIIEDNSCYRITECRSWMDTYHVSKVKDYTVVNQDGKCVFQCKNGTFGLYNECTEKWPNYMSILNDRLCVEGCPRGTFRQRNKPINCYFCHPECEGCFGKTESECNKCKHKKYNAKCVPNCPNKTFEDNGKCLDSCPDFSLNGKCVEQCSDGFYPTRDSAGNGICLEKCPHNYIVVNGKCTQNCKGYLQDEMCLEECPASQYILTHNNTCIPDCPSELINTSKCVRSCQQFLLQDECFQRCPNSHLTNVVNKTCVLSCPEAYPFVNGTTCTDHCPGVFYDHVCYDEICPNGFPTVDQECVIECPRTHPYLDSKTNKCKQNCTVLIMNNRCVEHCPPSYVAKNGTCVPRCPSNLFDLDGTCVDKCPQKILVSKQQCVSVCTNGTFITGIMCQQCNSECSDLASCSGAGPDQCEACRHYKYDSECVPDCPPTHSFIDENNHCVRICPTEVPFVMKGNNICISSCPYDYFEIPDDKGQKMCTEQCSLRSLLQTPEGQCVQQCPVEYPFTTKDFLCVGICPNGSLISVDYKGNSICVDKCSYPAKLQTPKNVCVEKCPHEYPLKTAGLYCVTVCPNGTLNSFDGTEQECVAKCSYPKLQTPRTECVDDCPNEYPFKTWDLNCVAKCPNESLKSMDHKGKKICVQTCSSPAELQTPQNECVRECPHDYPFKTKDKDCIAECKNGSFSVVESTDNKKCVERCSYPTEFQTPNNECVKKCPGDYPLKTWDLNCVAQCPDGSLRSVDSGGKTICVQRCSSPFGLQTPNACVKKCPHEYPWLSKENGTSYCGKTCPNGMLVHKANCVKRCPNETFPLFDSYCSLRSPKKCKKELDVIIQPCLTGFVDYCTGTCMSLCPTGSSIIEAFRIVKNVKETFSVCTKLTYKIGLPIVISCSVILISLSIYVTGIYITLRKKNPLLNVGNVRKLLLENENREVVS